MLIVLLSVQHDLLCDSQRPHILLLLKDKTVQGLSIDAVPLILILFEYLPVLGLLIPATVTTHTITITYLILALKVSLLEIDLLIGVEIIDLVDVVSMFAIIILLHVEQSFAVNRPFKVSSLDGFGLWHNFDHMLQLLLVFLCLKVSGADGAFIASRFAVWRR